ncbi:hypothetical protein E2C01_097446 [Portunus trituberculatus]|uniref:Uncharacterized protein n=1 Tax=Portunus trituberculatus TaxID=210409 RepID=A0A5B7K9L5_PORTR|nr:hypothetical protein [Portunus trituberculatus]
MPERQTQNTTMSVKEKQNTTLRERKQETKQNHERKRENKTNPCQNLLNQHWSCCHHLESSHEYLSRANKDSEDDTRSCDSRNETQAGGGRDGRAGSEIGKERRNKK